jgi:choline dehydrogenase
MNSGYPSSDTREVTYISDKGVRVSSETAYFTPDVLARPNLKVAIHAQVTRIIFDAKRAVGVEFANTPDGPRFRAGARKQVVLSCVSDPHGMNLRKLTECIQRWRNPLPTCKGNH